MKVLSYLLQRPLHSKPSDYQFLVLRPRKDWNRHRLAARFHESFHVIPQRRDSTQRCRKRYVIAAEFPNYGLQFPESGVGRGTDGDDGRVNVKIEGLECPAALEVFRLSLFDVWKALDRLDR